MYQTIVQYEFLGSESIFFTQSLTNQVVIVKPEETQLLNLPAGTITGGNNSFQLIRSVVRKAGVYKKWGWAYATLMFALWPLPNHAEEEYLSVLTDEPPHVRTLLEKAMKIELSSSNSNKMWRAATLYCEASRFGSIEAQYRLGMLYTFGRGVPENRVFAAALFSQAAQQGHAQAVDMLEAVPLRTSELPACMTDPSKLPERPVIQKSLC